MMWKNKWMVKINKKKEVKNLKPQKQGKELQTIYVAKTDG